MEIFIISRGQGGIEMKWNYAKCETVKNFLFMLHWQGSEYLIPS